MYGQKYCSLTWMEPEEIFGRMQSLASMALILERRLAIQGAPSLTWRGLGGIGSVTPGGAQQ